MGWKGTVRSINSSIKASQREAARRDREYEKQRKIDQKNKQLFQTRKEYDEYALYCQLIVSLHHECSDPIDWESVSQMKEPKKPRPLKKHENEARNQLDNYKPGLIDKIFKREPKKIQSLKLNVNTAVQKDDQVYTENIDKWNAKKGEWLKETGLANQLLNNDPESKIKVIEHYNPFSKISQIGSEIKFSIEEGSILTGTINVHGNEIIPDKIKSVLQSGKLSTKKMPKGQYNELYQDHVCSVVLRIANEIFSLLPDDLVIINAVDEMLNPKTGHHEEAHILSVALSRSTLSELNLKKLDPSDSMRNFVHHMSFKKLKGFEAIEPIDSADFVKNGYIKDKHYSK